MKLIVLVVPAFRAPPLFIKSPETVRVYAPEIVSVVPELMVSLLQSPPAEPIIGLFGVELMITFVVEVGTVELLQLPGVFQSALTVPVHELDEVAMVIIPKAEAKLGEICAADDPVPPQVPLD